MNKQINLFWIALVLSAIIFTSCHVKSIALSQSDVVLAVNETVILIATTLPDNAKNKAVSWSSSDETVATVDTNGLVKALKAGTATITVKTEDGGVSATCSVTVTSMVKLELKDKSFQMGAEYTGSYASYDWEKPVHTVNFTRDIYICDHEVTQVEYEKYCKYSSSSPSDSYGKGNNNPVYYVSWYDAIVYCNLRSMDEGLTPCYKLGEETDPKKWADIQKDNETNPTKFCGPASSNTTWDGITCDFTKNGYRLPTEAEWEYAARGGIADNDKPVWAGTTEVGDSEANLKEYLWYSDNAGGKTHEVKKLLPNGYGLYDMSGNVWEWCWDWYGSYASEDATDPVGAVSGSGRVGRGGSWGYDAGYCRASNRGNATPGDRIDDLGFRLARSSS